MQLQLVVTEKPSVAKSIAKVIGATSNKDGYCEGNGYIVSWCIGHLVALSEPEEYDPKYKKWDVSLLPIIPEKWKYSLKSSTKGQFYTIKKLMERDDVTNLIEATDAGREGELIFRLVYYFAKCNKPFKRLWISSMTDDAIKDGFDKLRDGREYDNLYRSAKCRSEADWLVGMNGTRLFTCLYGAGNTLPIGRVQTPTLHIIVERDISIKNFVSAPYYRTHITANGIEAVTEDLSKREAESLANKLLNNTAIVKDVQNTQKKTMPPLLYDLTSLQKDANKLLGYTAQQTLSYLQELYEKKFVTYPRTDSKYITDDMEISVGNIIGCLLNKFNISAVNNFKTNIKRIINNDKVTDHHAIIPTDVALQADFDTLTNTHKKLFYLIAYRLLMAVDMPYIYLSTKIHLSAAAHDFTATGATVREYGFLNLKKQLLAIIGKTAEKKDKELPEVEINQKLSISEAKAVEYWTKPKPHYTEATILAEMEKAGAKEISDDAERKGLGTPATRAAIIEKLIKDGLIIRDKSNLLASDKGINLIQIVPAEIKSPSMTADWENKLADIALGKYSSTEFMDNIKRILSEWIEKNKIPNKEYIQLFNTVNNEKTAFAICPKCGGSIYENNKAYSCENKDFVLFKDNKYFSAFKKKITKSIAKKLFETGQCYIPDLLSKKNKTFAATIIMTAETDSQYPKFDLQFPNKQ